MGTRTFISFAFGTMLAFNAGVSAQQPAATPPLLSFGSPVTLEQAKKVAEAAEAEANKNGWHMAIAVASNEGNLIYLGRVGDISSDSSDAAIRNATSAAVALRRFQDAVTANPQARPRASMTLSATSEAGFPLFADGKVIGAIGCSGGAATENLLACRAGAGAVK
jgi:glc operon protein GlcG